MPKSDNIAAIATAPGRGGIGVVRISGQNLGDIALNIIGGLPPSRHARYTPFKDADGLVIDQGIALFFPGPNSYTGEDVLELQGHGGSAVLQLLLQRCLELGARLALPGEFTQRAYLNDKLDLAQAESVADLIDATTSQAARSAVRSMMGDFSRVIKQLVSQLIDLRMLVEAMLDFPEEELDVPDFTRRDAKLAEIRNDLQRTLELAQQGSLLREGAHVVLIGQPNVGKSSLLNCLSGEDVALVSEIPGTTRDVIRQSIQLNGVPMHIIDTAGLRETQDAVEQMGIARTRITIQKADVILLMLDANHGISEEDNKILAELPLSTQRLYIFNKIDLLQEEARTETIDGNEYIYLSAKSGKGIELLRDKLLGVVGWHQEAGVFMARERHLTALKKAQKHLEDATYEGDRAELFAEELRLAQEALNEITGEFTADDLLGEIFSRFCIGK
ncbi:MAG: tRNA uridine-5-carboxymethylaminomethyl(34) synthesis GTPase MnmE [Gallionellales bacterium 35-53-114]|nr:MAG: tRNA uridine-5-carboxymethylaminomethyl(34) synthesis GTPase MnmE [Gallionellales bacterium 35-53-114]OYZ63618.1 MAG: tRNA uridine-5-carboxymethylaminomethyl(34) synthesis GTPase MnmE [Gallionellales bacterium 24-53-125]OZB10986.1 MAG: tRNA uridine-5-carboxymethylaminomethyl(34) synthesis GTPase MnmE [Gallionellales bacterium 39-52-133]HQS59012.1 tRNA uridine-5-carboxymethylaminomethyl(34) synthesis GTPase MnmE [Gallionellaceae bacterium]HQS75603.1 tRNA uridine-5-carboxymethylaminomethy